MRLRLLVLAASLLGLLAVPASAGAAFTVGISENSPALFSDPLFQGLGAKYTRVVVSYDVMTRRDDELARITPYLEAARAAGIEALVTFEHSRGDASRCNRRANYRTRVCALPSTAAYERNVRLFFEAFPYVRAVAPWNEANHFTQPTSRNPRRAAQFTDIARRYCRGCKVVVLDVLDQANTVASRRPSYSRTLSYIRRFRRYLRAPRTICGLHNYSDTNRFRDTGTRQIIRALGCRQIWLTETGGIYKFGKSFPSSAARQLRATRYMFQLANRNRRIRRVYVYTWFGGTTQRFDAGLVRNGRARPALRLVRAQIRR